MRDADGDPLLNAWARGIVAAALIGSAGDWNGPKVWVLAIAAGASFFDLGRRDRVERHEASRTADEFTPKGTASPCNSPSSRCSASGRGTTARPRSHGAIPARLASSASR